MENLICNNFNQHGSSLQSHNDVLLDFEKKLLKLDKKFDALEQLFYDECINNRRNKDRKPHKCPICNGSAYIHWEANGARGGNKCQSCYKGIIWE